MQPTGVIIALCASLDRDSANVLHVYFVLQATPGFIVVESCFRAALPCLLDLHASWLWSVHGLGIIQQVYKALGKAAACSHVQVPLFTRVLTWSIFAVAPGTTCHTAKQQQTALSLCCLAQLVLVGFVHIRSFNKGFHLACITVHW
jgi:hypothetical protein